ncbi:hypothetical protein [Synechococcus sp. BIOS-U3-1]|uniref:hypothetical protein n=1 Tax=Synechococcus sp. BIOS-U3-1 TaxID=1400865 RepID=UPI0016474E5E|nr:hypothetical protein [Synechococcus sp. BIOS-U3-1]
MSRASNHYCHDLDLNSDTWRLNYDEEELDGLSEVEARKKYHNDQIEQIIFDHSQYPSLPGIDIDELALFYDEHSFDIKAGFECWRETYTYSGSKVIRLAHHHYSEAEDDQHPQDHKLYKAFVAAYAIRHWLLIYQEILDYNRSLAKNNERCKSLFNQVNTMELEKIMAEEPFVITTHHHPAKPSVKPDPAAEQLSLPITHEGDYILVRDKSGLVHFKKRQTTPNVPKNKSTQLTIPQKTGGVIYERFQRLAELITATAFPCLKKRREAKKLERIKHVRQRIERYLNCEWKMIILGDGEDEDGNFYSFYEYQHRDGRKAIQFSDGSCTDPDLKEFLFQVSLDRMERKQSKRNRK